MKRILKQFLLLVTILSLATTLVGCASGGKDSGEESQTSSSTDSAADQGQAASQSSTDEATPTYGGEIVVGISQDLDSLDPHKAEAAGTREVLFNVFEGLVKPDSEGNYVPAVASAYKVSDDAKTYTFTLREGVKFHNGELVTAEDVKYSIERCADDSNGTPLVEQFANIQSVEITDSQTITITLKEADTEFIAYMNTAIIPASNSDPATNVIGTGPFKFVSRSAQENIVLEKNTDYWGEQAYLDKVTFKIESNSDTVVTDLKAGSIDMYVRLSTDQAAQLEDSDFNILEGTMNLVQGLYLNNAQEPKNDVSDRQALCYAVDVQGI
jgi:peptide/nickel transport system substrate-binding protein